MFVYFKPFFASLAHCTSQTIFNYTFGSHLVHVSSVLVIALQVVYF